MHGRSANQRNGSFILSVFTPEDCKKSDATEMGAVIRRKVALKSSRYRNKVP